MSNKHIYIYTVSNKYNKDYFVGKIEFILLFINAKLCFMFIMYY